MGEAKRRRDAEGPRASEQEILRAVRARSQTATAVEGLDVVQVLVVDLTLLDEAKAALGGLPQICQSTLKQLQTVSGPAATAIAWQIWPSGRQESQLLTSSEAYRDAFSIVLECARARGFGVQVATFTQTPWDEKLLEYAPTHCEKQRHIAECIEHAPPLRVRRTPSNILLMYVPQGSSHDDRVGVNAHLLRLFDDLAVNKESLTANHNAVYLGFDGYDDDPREVWEFEAVRQTLSILHLNAPWWPWVAHAEQFVMWLGALAAEGLTDVTAQLTVGFSISEESLMELVEEFMMGCFHVLAAAGINIVKEPAASKARRHFAALGETARQVNQRAMDLQLGLVKRATIDQRKGIE